MLKTVVGVVGLAAPEGEVKMTNGAILHRGTTAELDWYFGGGSTNPIARSAYFEDVLVFLPPSDEPTIAVLDRLAAVLQLSVDSAVGLCSSRDVRGVLVDISRGVNLGMYLGPDPVPAVPDRETMDGWFHLWGNLESRAELATLLRVRRAMRRYQRSLEEPDDEAVFHLVAACEAVVSPEHAERGQHRRFVKRVSKVLTDHSKQRRKIEAALEEFWSRRSGFAHGDQGSEGLPVDQLRSYTHGLLQMAIEQPRRFDKERVRDLG